MAGEVRRQVMESPEVLSLSHSACSGCQGSMLLWKQLGAALLIHTLVSISFLISIKERRRALTFGTFLHTWVRLDYCTDSGVGHSWALHFSPLVLPCPLKITAPNAWRTTEDSGPFGMKGWVSASDRELQQAAASAEDKGGTERAIEEVTHAQLEKTLTLKCGTCVW